MTKLLRADLVRMWKAKPFWVCVIISFALAAVNIITLNKGWEEHTARLFLKDNFNSLLLIGIFAPLFLGTEYSNGTLRNKLMVGSRRVHIYLSNLITVAFGSLLIAVTRWIPNIVTAFFGKSFGMGAEEFALQMLTVICAIIAMSAVFTLLGMLISSKSASTAISISMLYVLIVGAAIIMSLLNQPEYIYGDELTEDGILQTDPPNPAYVSGIKRDILTAVYDVLPSGQMMQIENEDVHNAKLMPLFSLGVLAVGAAAGAAVFRKKDLK